MYRNHLYLVLKRLIRIFNNGSKKGADLQLDLHRNLMFGCKGFSSKPLNLLRPTTVSCPSIVDRG